MYDQSRNMSAALYVIPQGNVTLGIQGYVNGTQVLNVTYPDLTTEVGEVEGLVRLNTSGMVKAGAGKLVPQPVTLYSNGTLSEHPVLPVSAWHAPNVLHSEQLDRLPGV